MSVDAYGSSVSRSLGSGGSSGGGAGISGWSRRSGGRRKQRSGDGDRGKGKDRDRRRARSRKGAYAVRSLLVTEQASEARSWLFCGLASGRVVAIDRGDWAVSHTAEAHEQQPVLGLQWCGQQERLYSASADGTIKVWAVDVPAASGSGRDRDAHRPKLLCQGVMNGHSAPVRAISM